MLNEDRISEGEGTLPVLGGSPLGIVAAYRMARAVDPGGGPFTRLISGPLGSWIAAIAIRRGLHPSLITLASFVVGTGTSGVVVLVADHAQPWWAPGWVALAGWQLAYVLDCADGQIARATGRTSEYGARLDVLVDYAVHTSIVCALAAVAWQSSIAAPVPLLTLAASLWFIGTVAAVLKRSDSSGNHSFLRGRNPLVEAIRLAGDNGAVVFVVGGWLLVHPQSVVVPIAALTLVNGGHLLASIAREARMSMRDPSGSL